MAKQLPKQLEVAVSWAKNNTLAVVFTAIVILVPVGGYFAADMMGEGVRKEAQRRAQVVHRRALEFHEAHGRLVELLGALLARRLRRRDVDLPSPASRSIGIWVELSLSDLFVQVKEVLEGSTDSVTSINICRSTGL